MVVVTTKIACGERLRTRRRRSCKIDLDSHLFLIPTTNEKMSKAETKLKKQYLGSSTMHKKEFWRKKDGMKWPSWKLLQLDIINVKLLATILQYPNFKEHGHPRAVKQF